MPLFEGDMIRLGESSRLMIIHGLTERPEAPMPKSSRAYENSSVAWGMTEQDADDTASGPPTSLLDIGTGESKDSSSSYYHKDPKKALKTWFEAQGYEYEISYQEELIQGDRGFIASIDLPNLDFPLSAAGRKLPIETAYIDN